MAERDRAELAAEASEVAAALERVRSALRSSILEQVGQLQTPATPQQLHVIELLVDATRESGSGLTVSELSRRMALSHSTVSGIVDRLVARGFVARRQSDDDRRYVRVELTAEVRHWLEDELPVSRLEPLIVALAGCSQLERSSIVRALGLLADRLSEDGSPPVGQG